MSRKAESVSSFGQQLRSMREERHMSLREVANELGIDASLLGKIEREERFPTNIQIKRLAKYFCIDESKLIQERLSDLLAYTIIQANADATILKVAEQKIKYFKKSRII